MAAQRYPKAPIVEAIIDLKVSENFSEREKERLRDRLKRRFPSIEERHTFNVEFALNMPPKQKTELAGFKLTAQNGADVVLINDSSFGTVRLAPYDCWDTFLAQAKQNFEEFTKVVGRKSVSRVGVRFINRMDIPNRLIFDRPVTTFFRVGVMVPSDLTGVIGKFSFSAEGVEKTTNTPFILRFSMVTPPPLIEHLSFKLDIDAYWDTEIPARIDEMWDGVQRLRTAKNAIFEQSITDELRSLFR